MDNLILVTFTAPCKLGARHYQPGDEDKVDGQTATLLLEAGVIANPSPAGLAPIGAGTSDEGADVPDPAVKDGEPVEVAASTGATADDAPAKHVAKKRAAAKG